MAVPRGCLLVGSVPLKDTETVLTKCADALPGRLAAIPDGETRKRIQYTQFQIPLFPQKSLAFDGKMPLSDDEVATLTQELEQSTFETGYDTAAFESYEIFKRLRKEGKISKQTKFQVGIPTIGNVVGAFIKPELQKTAEKLYEKGLFESIARLQASIPHDDLVIQVDMGMDLSYWEDLGKTGDYWSWVPWSAWFNDRSYVVEYLSRLINQVDPAVDLGLHYCYGDLNHKHFSEPESLASIVDLHVQLMKKIQRGPAAYIHCPVPLSAMDKLEGFYAPLQSLIPSLIKDSTKLYLGLVHANDLEGTKQRIQAASAIVDDFGIATECGLGRTPTEDITGVLNIMREVSQNI